MSSGTPKSCRWIALVPATPLTAYESTARSTAENAIVAVPTLVFFTSDVSNAWFDGGPDVVYKSPVIEVGDVHVPPGIAYQVGASVDDLPDLLHRGVGMAKGDVGRDGV